MGVTFRCRQLFVALTIVLIANQVQAMPQPLQCIEAPQRTKPCPNLIYTAINMEQKSKIICFCKSDKQLLLELLADKTSAKSRIALRKLLSQHNLNNEQLFNISHNVVN